MSWIATIPIDPDGSEMITARLWTLGTTGVAEVDGPTGTRLLAGFDDEELARAAVDAIGVDAADVAAIDDSVWATPAPTVVSVGDHDIHIDAGRAFGHGGHPTTRLCLDLLETVVESHHRVLDVGTGSGVLAIAADRLGAEHVVAIDIDPDAVATATSNARRNGSEALISSTPIAEIDGSFDVVVVNMLVAELEPIARAIAERSSDLMIVSGCLVDQAARVIESLSSPDRPVAEIDRRVDGDWVGLVLR